MEIEAQATEPEDHRQFYAKLFDWPRLEDGEEQSGRNQDPAGRDDDGLSGLEIAPRYSVVDRCGPHDHPSRSTSISCDDSPVPESSSGFPDATRAFKVASSSSAA